MKDDQDARIYTNYIFLVEITNLFIHEKALNFAPKNSTKKSSR